MNKIVDGVLIPLTQAEIDERNEEAASVYARDNSYENLRRLDYNLLNQLELISDDSINGTTTHRDAILAIKAKYPKPV